MNNYRREEALERRRKAAQLAYDRPHLPHIDNGDEQCFRHDQKNAERHGIAKGEPSYLMTFTKGMPHNEKTGLVNTPLNVQKFINAIDSGDERDFRDTPLGREENVGYECKLPDWLSEKAKTGNNGRPVGLRAWESQSAGLAFDLEGPDAQAVTMPPAPRLGSEELEGEMAEVYTQALLRDVPFHAYTNGVMGCGKGLDIKKDISPDYVIDAFDTKPAYVKQVQEFTAKLQKLDWFNEKVTLKLNEQEEIRRCDRLCPTPTTAYRGITPGDDIGPYLSQFLLVGNTGVNGNDAERRTRDGLITYGAISIDQRVRTATPGQNYMQTWEEWLDVQNAANVGALETYLPGNTPQGRRFIYTPRDLATYVHYDALYEAYLNACLILLSNGTPFDPGIPFQGNDKVDHQQGFAHFGGPHILSLVTEVATRALKAVRFQKYNVHRRLRPEALAARLFKVDELQHMAPDLREMFDNLAECKILDAVADENGKAGNYLLPMAFCEGSPMHPAYGAGHATVAGACVTILKAFFDHKSLLEVVPKDELRKEDFNILEKVKPGLTEDKVHSSNLAYVSVDQGQSLSVVPVLDSENKIAKLTVEGELNKLCSNISIGRDWAGVHYFTDYYESILMGEEIALGILEEQKLLFGENFSMTVPLFNGDTKRI
ncbi:vanadium-dependent haloperoxidase [uncultured Dokdonia sp.]|uniref:vanadium-dependent haloperoxidase n=1 Tax=uncultured Dokdonia sp. TaxID=575653 RepID=UPI00261D4667|nr:vanadium-dependent haloperoxidase [uncultured Dokdonia sp.]